MLLLSGAADSTVALQKACDALAAAGGGELELSAGVFRVSRIPHPEQPMAQADLTAGTTIIKVPDNVKLKGAGKGATVVLVTFPNHTDTADPATSMSVFVHGDNFEAEGITFRGDYDPATFQFLPLDNDNSMIIARNLRSTSQHVRDCEFTSIPGFYVGTSIARIARFSNNDVSYCGNGYNVSGSDVLVSGNTFYYSEGVESAGDRLLNGVYGGRIHVVDNDFYECNVAASLGGNTATDDGADSYNYLFGHNTVFNHDVKINAPVTIGPNAMDFGVTSNILRGDFRFGAQITPAGQPATATPRDGLIAGNYIDQLYTVAPGAESPLLLGHQDGSVSVVGNTLRTGAKAYCLNLFGAAPAVTHALGNVLVGRGVAMFSTGNTAQLLYGPNMFTPADGTRVDLVAGMNATDTTLMPATARAPVASGAQADQVAEFVSRVRGTGVVTDDTIAMYKRFYSGRQQWGPPSGGPVDVTLERSAPGALKVTGKLAATAGLGVGNSAAAATLGTVVRRMEVFDAAGNSLGFIPIYDTIT